MLFLSFDIGTSAVKSTVISPGRGVLASAEHIYPRPSRKLLPTEQDPESWWTGALAVAKELLSRHPELENQIAAIGVSGHMLGCLPVDGNGNPLRPALLHSDARAFREDSDIAGSIGRDVLYSRTGNTLSAQSTLCKILWLKNNEPDIYGKTARFLQSKDYLTAKMTGDIDTSDYSDGAHAELMDIHRFAYMDDILAALSLDTHKLPALHRGTDIAGYLTPEAARALGLKSGIPVIAGGGDGACANAGSGIGRGDTYCCIGTTAWLAYDAAGPVLDSKRRVFNIPSLDGRNIGVFGTMQAAGRCVDWVKSLLKINSNQLFNKLASQAPPGSGGLVFLPYLEGERSPIFDTNARGVFFNISAMHTRAHFCRAVLEGVAFALRSILDVHRLSVQIRDVRVIGGGSSSGLWRQVLADIWGANVWTTSVQASLVTSLGVAMAAGVGIGAYKSLREAASDVSLLTCTQPDRENTEIYEKLYRIFFKLYPQIKSLYEETGETTRK